MNIVVGITGASGAIIGFQLLNELTTGGHEVHCIISENADMVIRHELGKEFTLPATVTYYQERDMSAPFNSSSYPVDAMVIVPCSMKTLSALACGYAYSLIIRAAENMLRMRGRLIVVPRETPLSEASLRNMLRLHRAGAIILPPMVAYYHHPENVDDITRFFVGKILDLLNIPNDLYRRWGWDTH